MRCDCPKSSPNQQNSNATRTREIAHRLLARVATAETRPELRDPARSEGPQHRAESGSFAGFVHRDDTRPVRQGRVHVLKNARSLSKEKSESGEEIETRLTQLYCEERVRSWHSTRVLQSPSDGQALPPRDIRSLKS